MFSSKSRHVALGASLVIVMLFVAGCAPHQTTGSASVSVAENQKQIYAQLVNRSIQKQQESGLRLGQLVSPATCNPLVNGMPQSNFTQVDVQELELVNTTEKAMWCVAATQGGNQVKFVARSPGANAALNNVGEGLIGVRMTQSDATPVVDGFIPGGAAERALKKGDRLLGIAEEGDTEFTGLEGKTLQHVAALLSGKPGTSIRLMVIGKGEMQTREVGLTRARITADQREAYRKQAVSNLVIRDSSGQFMSPYTSDGVVAEWVDKAINAKMGGSTGSALGAAAGQYAANKALESVPFVGGMVASAVGSKLGEEAGRQAAIDASGGEAYIRKTSDLSFNSINNMAVWLVTVHGDKRNFSEVVSATNEIYEGVEQAVNRVAARSGRQSAQRRAALQKESATQEASVSQKTSASQEASASQETSVRQKSNQRQNQGQEIDELEMQR